MAKRKTYRIETRRNKDDVLGWRPYPNAWGVSRDWAQGFMFAMDGVYGAKYDFRMVDEETEKVAKEQIARPPVHLNSKGPNHEGDTL